jgi:hypothetical protein
MGSLEEIVAKLLPEHQQEVRDFALFLAEKRARPKRWKLWLNWAGGLKEFRDRYTLWSYRRSRWIDRTVDFTIGHIH